MSVLVPVLDIVGYARGILGHAGQDSSWVSVKWLGLPECSQVSEMQAWRSLELGSQVSIVRSLCRPAQQVTTEQSTVTIALFGKQQLVGNKRRYESWSDISETEEPLSIMN